MDKTELIKRYELATSKDYDEIRKRALNYIVHTSSSDALSKENRGMLLLIKWIDGWIDDYNEELARRSN